MTSNEKFIQPKFAKNLKKDKIVCFIDTIFYSIWFKIWFKLLDFSISLIFLTTYETEFRKKKLRDNLALFILTISLAIIIAPVGLLCMLIWIILIRVVFRKKPYQLAVNADLNNTYYFDSNKSYEILSTNLCLLPETVSRLNNLHQTDKRLVEIGRILTTTTTTSSSNLKLKKNKLVDYDENNNEIEKFIEIVDNFSDHSENIDFICVQEIWTVGNGLKLKELLHHKYPFIVFDIGVNGFSSNCLIGLDSGLMFCSKYPILKIAFKTFCKKMNACRFSSKGLLIVKVNLMGFNI
jgi:sphingomyelin phosphodiesterase 3